MSVINAILPLQGSNTGSTNTNNGSQNGSTSSSNTTSETQPSGGSNTSTGGSTATSGETTQTSSQIPAVTASRSTNATSSARSGGEGALVQDRQTAEVSEAQVRREAEAVRRKAIQKELLSRIPVPVEAIPKLTGDVETVRSIGEPTAEPKLDAVA